jgi:nucleotidyltransferase/DNA polymerase involved in DNA repair
VIDGEEAATLLAPQGVRLLPGVGVALARKLETIGITRLGQLQALQDRDAKLGDHGPGLIRRARSEDAAWSTLDAKRNRSARKPRLIMTCLRYPTWNVRYGVSGKSPHAA